MRLWLVLEEVWVLQSSWFTFCFCNGFLWRLHNLSVALQAHLVAAFEQSLGNMTIRLKSLTLTAEQKVNSSSGFHNRLHTHQSAHSKWVYLLVWPSCHFLCVGLWAEWVEEDHRAAEEAERCCSGCHQRSHQHTWTHAYRGQDRYRQTLQILRKAGIFEGHSWFL